MNRKNEKLGKVSILVISLENEKIRTEEIYFANKNNKDCLSFNKDNNFKKNLNIQHVFFFSLNINFTQKKLESKIEKLLLNDSLIKEVYILCDRDNKSYSDKQIQEKIDLLKNTLEKTLNNDFGNFKYLKYPNEGGKFENFLELHFKNKKLYKEYRKTDKDLYKKTMGENGKNVKIFEQNTKKYPKYKDFFQLFKIRKIDLDE